MVDKFVEAQKLLAKHLVEEEYVIWNGQPGMNDFLNLQIIANCFLGGFYCTFGIMAFNEYVKTNYDFIEFGILLVFAVVLLTLGSCIIIFSFVLERRCREKIYYFLTNKRLFFIRDDKIEFVEDLQNHNRDVKELKNGNKTIDFDPNIFSERPCCSFAKQLRFALVDIADADLVLDLIKHGPIAKTFSQYENRPNDQLLEEHEWMLWKGSPHKGHLLYPKEIGFILFSSFWTLGLLYVIIFRISLEGMISIFPVSLIPLLMFIIGCYLLFGRFIVEANRRKKLQYMITNKKVVIKCGQKQKIYTKDDLQIKLLHRFSNGSGHIQLVNEITPLKLSGETIKNYLAGISDYCSVFVNVEDVDYIMTLLSKLQ